MTASMLERARASSQEMGLANVERHEAVIEDLPLDDGSVDVVISNGMIDLVPDKDAVFDESSRRSSGEIEDEYDLPDDTLERIDASTVRAAGEALMGSFDPVQPPSLTLGRGHQPCPPRSFARGLVAHEPHPGERAGLFDDVGRRIDAPGNPSHEPPVELLVELSLVPAAGRG